MKIRKLQLLLLLGLRLLVFLGIIAAIAYCAICIFLFVQQPKFIFFPSSVIEKTPQLFNLPYQEVWIPVKTSLGKVEKIHGW